MLVLLFVALWFILRGDLFYILPCGILFLCVFFSIFLALRLPRLGKIELILVLFVFLFDLCLFGFVGFLFLLVSVNGLWFALPTVSAFHFVISQLNGMCGGRGERGGFSLVVFLETCAMFTTWPKDVHVTLAYFVCTTPLAGLRGHFFLILQLFWTWSRC